MRMSIGYSEPHVWNRKVGQSVGHVAFSVSPFKAGPSAKLLKAYFSSRASVIVLVCTGVRLLLLQAREA